MRTEQRRLEEIRSERYQLTKLKEKLEARLLKKRKKKNIAFHIRNLKIVRDTGRFLVPFVVCAGLAVGGGALIGCGLPLKEDTYTKPKLTTYTIEAQGEYQNLEEEYVSFGPLDDVKDSSLTIYTPWEEVHEGFFHAAFDREKKKTYKRERRVYGSAINSLEVINALMRHDYDSIINSVEGYSVEVQTCNELHEEPAYRVEGKIYILDRGDYLTFKEDPETDLWVTVIEAILALGIGGVIAYKRDYGYIWQIQKDIREYRSVYNDWKDDADRLAETNERLLALRRGGR